MAIAKMHHFKLYTLKSLTDEMLSFLQNYGDVHISNLSEDGELLDSGLEYISEPEESLIIRDEISKIESGIEILSKYEEKLGTIESLKRGNKNYTFEELMEKGSKIDISDIINKINELKLRSEEEEKRISDVSTEIQELLPWKNLKLSAEEIKNTRNISFITGYMLSPQFDAFMKEVQELEYTHVEKVDEYEKNTYLLAIVENNELEKLNEIFRKFSFFEEKVNSAKSPVQEIKAKEEEIKSLKDEIKKINKEFESNAGLLDDLKLRYEYLKQIDAKYKTSNNFLSTKRVNLIDGYLKSDDVKEFSSKLEEHFKGEYYIEMEEAKKDDSNVPIILENNWFVEPFESMTSMYSMPAYNEIDPTPFLAPFYWLFFGMMMADIGFGILLLVGTFILLRFNLSDSMRRMIKFFHYLGYSTLLWGIIYGSFFGGIIDLPTFIDPAKDYMTVLILSVVFGGVHMFLGLGLQAYMLIRDGKPLDAFYDVISWYLVLFGAIYMIISGPLNLPYGNIAKYIMILGMILIVLFTGRAAGSPVGRFASGAYNLYGLSSWIGDFVSYLRLMALGLSGGFIGVAINMIVGTMTEGRSIVGFIFALVIFVGGQLFNFGLSALSAYVHTLRLIFVEFFGKFYEGGGKAFKSVRNETKYINIKKQEE